MYVASSAPLVVPTFRAEWAAPAGMVDELQDAYTGFWRKRARLPESWLPLPRGIFHVLSADQALQYGVVDELVER